jgi:hypothetical protein
MPAELKNKVARMDASASSELAQIIKSQFRAVTPVLLTFSTFVRFFWKFEEFRTAISADTLRELLSTCLASDNSHVVSSGLAAAANVSAVMGPSIQQVVDSVVVPYLLLTGIQHQSQGTLKQLVSARHNCLVGLTSSEPEIQSALARLLRDSLDLIPKHRMLSDHTLVHHLATATDKACERIRSQRIPCSLENVDQAVMISSIEQIESLLGITMPNTIKLILE